MYSSPRSLETRRANNESTHRIRSLNLSVIVPLVVALAAMTGCGGDLTRNPVPVQDIETAEVPNQPNVRGVGLALDTFLQEDLEQSLRDEDDDAYCSDENGEPTYCILALSGGAGFGAFGAGFLKGWSDAGTRPNFKIVTGISTGALIAPFAFVGSDYDEALKTVYTGVDDEDIFRSKGVLAVLGDESFLDSAPLAGILDTYVDKEFLKRVADAHAAGRRLIIGTTNLDRQEFVLWNMGAIVGSSDPDSAKLFRQIMLASASVPGLFSPVYIDVEVDGQLYDEMHGDGSVFAPVFFHAAVVDPKSARDKVVAEDGRARPKGGKLYVIRHGEVYPEPDQVERRIEPILRRVVSTTVKAMTLASLYFMYIEAEASDIEFNYIGVPEGFNWGSAKEFNIEEMTRLYQVGYDLAQTTDPWEKKPPQFDQSPLAQNE